MKNLTSKIAMTLTLLGATSLVSNASANDYRRINREAQRIERKANLLIQEAVHYEAMPQHCHLVRDLEDFVRLSQHITDLVRVSPDLRLIKADVRELARTFRHVEGLFDQIERQIARGRGVKFGNTAHVKRLLNNIEDCIHVMLEDIAVLEVRARRDAFDRNAYGSNRYYGGRNVPNYNAGRGTYYQGGTIYNSGGIYNSGSYYRGGTGGYCPNARNRGNGIEFSIGGGSSRLHFRF